MNKHCKEGAKMDFKVAHKQIARVTITRGTYICSYIMLPLYRKLQ